jgi:mono/diheme cytochrome c family protein
MARGIAVAMGAALVAACFTGGEPSGDAGADASDATALPEPAALFATTCAPIGCHVGPDAPFHLDLSPDAYYANLVDVPANEVAGAMRVKPGSPSDTQSYLLCKVDPECAVVGQHMPFAGSLTTEQIASLRSWVASLPPDDAAPPPSTLDTTGPSFAGAVAATPGPSSITLSWAPATDDVTPQSEIVYGIFESTTPGGESFGSPLVFTPPGATSYAVGPLPPNSTYYFVVLAFDWAHNDDGHDDIEVSATTPSAIDSTLPTFGGATTAVTKSPGSVALSWAPASDDVSQASAISYLVYASTTSGGEDFQSPDVVTVAGATSATSTDLGGDTLYYFVVRAKDQAGNIDTNTTEVTATTTHVGFTSDVEPLFAQSCTAGVCHAGPYAAESIDLSSPQTAHDTLVAIPSTECSGLSLVAPSQPRASYLLQKLRGHGSCFSGWPMPEQTAPLTSAQIDLVSAWIGKGAPLD